MNCSSRRNFLFASSGAAAGTILVSGSSETEAAGVDFSASGLVTGKPKSLRHASIPGFLSAEQIAPHHTAHYGGALRGYSGIDSKLKDSIKTGTAIDANAYGAMQRARQSKGNSVILHELYFDGLVPDLPDPQADVRKAIEKRFGSLEKMGRRFSGQCADCRWLGGADISSGQWKTLQRRQRRTCHGTTLDGDSAGRNRCVRTRLLHRLSKPKIRIYREVHGPHRLD
jgi:hypothetical protein